MKPAVLPSRVHALASRLRPPSREEREIVTDMYLAVLGREPDPGGLRGSAARLRGGASRGQLFLDLARSEEYLHRTVSGLAHLHDGTDEEFLRAAYRALLMREPDEGGFDYFAGRLRAGAARTDVARELAASDEHVNRVVRGAYPLPDLRQLRPSSFADLPTVDGSERIPVFLAGEPADFDWLEDAILSYDYYDRPGIWSLHVDDDKRLTAELIGALAPRRTLELGCSSGAVLGCLAEQGVEAWGIDLSASAVAQADPSVRPRIICGDLLAHPLADGGYDVVYGLDIFEHLNPNRLDAYLDRIVRVLSPDGLLYANIPAFGVDPVFGEVFEMFLPEWREDAAAGRHFHAVQVEEGGYPCHGHLIWADTRWWQTAFERAGLRRVPEIERGLRSRYGDAMRRGSTARLAYYVFARENAGERIEKICAELSG